MEFVDRLRRVRPRGAKPFEAAVPLDAKAEADAGIPIELSVATGWAVRLLVVGVFVVALFQVLAYFAAVTVPLAIGLLLAALLQPLVIGLRRTHMSSLGAAAVALAFTVLLLTGVLTLVGTQATLEAPNLVNQTIIGLQQVTDWLAVGPLHVSTDQLNEYLAQTQQWLQSQTSALAGMAAGVGASVGSFLAGMVIALLAAFFFLASGSAMWSGAVPWLVPSRYALRITLAARQGWASLVSYMQATLIVSFSTALLIAVSAWVLAVPMPVALFALTFVAAFVPIVGALLAGLVAVALALVSHGWASALIMLGAVVVVNVLEANVVAPLLMSRAASLHPLAIMVGLTAGATVAGILGALLAIPVLAFAAAFARAYRYPSERPAPVRPTGSSPAAPPEATGPRTADRGPGGPEAGSSGEALAEPPDAILS